MDAMRKNEKTSAARKLSPAEVRTEIERLYRDMAARYGAEFAEFITGWHADSHGEGKG
jgi:hypothetical protein